MKQYENSDTYKSASASTKSKSNSSSQVKFMSDHDQDYDEPSSSSSSGQFGKTIRDKTVMEGALGNNTSTSTISNVSEKKSSLKTSVNVSSSYDSTSALEQVTTESLR